MTDLADAFEAIRDGDLVVYPTETVYGLGANALDAGAIERVFETKGRPRDDPLSMGVPDVATAMEYTVAGEVARACMDAFLPGPVTVICEKAPTVPDELTGGRDRVGIRIPDHDVALALLERPADVGADVIVGEADVLGLGRAYGMGLGLFVTREDYLRQVPGRLVGAGEDASGRRAYTLTLQTR